MDGTWSQRKYFKTRRLETILFASNVWNKQDSLPLNLPANIKHASPILMLCHARPDLVRGEGGDRVI